MTSFAFILGCVPLWAASGSGAIARQVMGTNRDRRHAGSEPDRCLSDSGQLLLDRKVEGLEAVARRAKVVRTWKVRLLSALGACSEHWVVSKAKRLARSISYRPPNASF